MQEDFYKYTDSTDRKRSNTEGKRKTTEKNMKSLMEYADEMIG